MMIGEFLLSSSILSLEQTYDWYRIPLIWEIHCGEFGKELPDSSSYTSALVDLSTQCFFQ